MYKSLDKKGKTVMRLNAIISGVVALVICGLLFCFIYPEITSTMGRGIMVIILLIVILFVVLNICLFPNIRYERYKYLIDDERVEVKKGLFLITHSIIQIKRIQKIELNSGPIDRLYDLSNVEIHTAAGATYIKFLNNKEALEVSEKVNSLLKKELLKNEEN